MVALRTRHVTFEDIATDLGRTRSEVLFKFTRTFGARAPFHSPMRNPPHAMDVEQATRLTMLALRAYVEREPETNRRIDEDPVEATGGHPMNAPAHSPLVTAKDGRAIADSRDVAAMFGTPHEDVLQAVWTLMSDSPEWGPLHVEEAPYVDDNGQTCTAYEIDYDAFVVIGPEFVGDREFGADDMRTARAYITAFRAMEARIKAPQLKAARKLKAAA